MLVTQFISLAIYFDVAANIVDAVQQPSMIQAPLWIPLDHLTFELELHNRGGLLHSRH